MMHKYSEVVGVLKQRMFLRFLEVRREHAGVKPEALEATHRGLSHYWNYCT